MEGNKEELEESGEQEGEETGRNEELRDREIETVIKKLKKKKAAGMDGIQNETWNLGGKGVRKAVSELCRRVWKGEGLPEDWREGVIVPVAKKSGAMEVGDHRGITLLQTAYKIYATILGNRLTEEAEDKKIIPEWQAGFRKGRGAIDNIYVLNYVIGRELEKGKEVIAVMVDLKAAFDSVDRGVMRKRLKEEGISKRLRDRIGEIYEETRSVVRVGESCGEKFWTEKGVRQGCPLSPTLFNIMIADLGRRLERDDIGGVKVGQRKVKVLGYADDLVLLAEDEEGMRWMIKRLERYMEEKKLVVNVGKTKIIRFKRGRGRRRKVDWWWKGEKIEEVKEIKYLGYVFRKNGGQERQIRERVRKAMGVMGQVWGIGKRKFRGDWERRIKMFDWLVGSVLGYGAEIWGWKEWGEIERVQEKYLRWVLGVEWRTPGYMVREESKRDKMRLRMGRRAVRYEEKLEEGEGSEWTRGCWEEVKKREGKRASIWEEQRKGFYKERGMSEELVKRIRREGGEVIGQLEERDREVQAQERFERIEKSRWNKWYKEIRTVGLPRYLKEYGKEERLVRIARFRLGNEMKEGRYWEREEERRCRLCGWELESWEHVVEICMGERERGGRERIREILEEDGRGESWMKRLQERREERMETETE